MRRSRVKRYYLLNPSNKLLWRYDEEPEWCYMTIHVSTTLKMYRFAW